MRPYGFTQWNWRDEDFGPTSKYVGGRMRSRRKWRQLMDKKGRRLGKRDLQERIKDYEGLHV